MTEKTYLLTLMDLETWESQKIWVKTTCPHQWQGWVDTFDFDPPLTIAHPSVVRVQEYPTIMIPAANPVH